MRDVAVVSFAQHTSIAESGRNEVEMLLPVISEVFRPLGIGAQDMGFVCSGSSDYLQGRPFAFVMALDAVGPWPPLAESHVEMDGAWALYEAWVRLQAGDIDTALVYGFGRASTGETSRTLALQLEPYTMAPLFPDATSLAALQARAWIDAGEDPAAREAAMARVAARSLASARGNPYALRNGDPTVEHLLAGPMLADPLRESDVADFGDGAAAIVLATGDRARELCDRPAWISGIDHRIEPHALGLRDLTTSVSTRQAAAGAGVANGPVDVAELHAPYSHQELILTEALGLGDDVVVNPSGGALAANPVMATGLIRIGEVARRIHGGDADRGVAHATSGACLQQNLVATLEARS